MSKILVDILPTKPEECPFAEYIHMTSKHECQLKSSLYSPHTQNLCDLECGKECNKLTTPQNNVKTDPDSFREL